MILLLLGLCLAAAAYQTLAIAACLFHLARREPEPGSTPPVSVLKPLRGADEGLLPALRSHAAIDYPEFEIVFGVQSADDPAAGAIRQLEAEFPALRTRTVVFRPDTPNAKAGVLAKLSEEARYPLRVVNDADISVPPAYLRRLASSLADQQTALVTCLYRASAGSFPATVEALGIATDFTPSALVAPFVGVREFGLGSTLAFRAPDMERAGGFRPIAEYLADDYQTGKRLHALGGNIVLSKMAVSTHLHGSWADIWRHQVRWARTIRISRGGYYGLPVTNATLWALLALAAGFRWAAVLLLVLRLAAGLIAGLAVLQDPLTRRWWWLMPVRDLFGFAVWCAGAVGNTVEWRGRHLRLTKDGRISG